MPSPGSRRPLTPPVTHTAQDYFKPIPTSPNPKWRHRKDLTSPSGSASSERRPWRVLDVRRLRGRGQVGRSWRSVRGCLHLDVLCDNKTQQKIHI
uniref:Uncharacterized protein n=1 Tax=Pyxicephalus adspersus TaxID=30357 RepID=A0AAV3B7N4_PYXAD|nr:TPA: hypothetical protein GDO54_001814 [Pyxicephalus adspersus]